MDVFLCVSFDVFWEFVESSYGDGSLEYPQHVILLPDRKKYHR